MYKILHRKLKIELHEPPQKHGWEWTQVLRNMQKGGSQKPLNWMRTVNTMTKGKRTKRQIMMYKILHRKLKIDLHEPHKNGEGVNSGALENIVSRQRQIIQTL